MFRLQDQLSFKERFGDHIGVVLFDLNGTMMKDEHCQQKAWNLAVDRHLQASSAELGVQIRVTEHIQFCFEMGKFDVFAPGLYDLMRETLVPRGITNSEECDRYLTELREDILRQMIDAGDITAVRGSEGVLKRLHAAGLKRGLYTNSPRSLARMALNHFIGEGVEVLLPEKHRLYGDRVPSELKKPHPWGWTYLACSQLGEHTNNSLIVEDRPTVIKRALDEGFAGAVGVCHDGNVAAWNEILGDRESQVALVPDFEGLTV